MSWTNLIKLCVQDEFDEDKFTRNITQLHTTSMYESTVLHFSIIGGNIEAVKFLIHQNPKFVNQPNLFGETPLHWACKDGDLDVVKILLKHKANVDQPDAEENTPLHWAAEYDRKDIIKLLLQKNANTRARNSSNKTPIEVANENRSRKTKKYLKGLAAVKRRSLKLIQNPL